jgi:hypothetical protein
VPGDVLIALAQFAGQTVAAAAVTDVPVCIQLSAVKPEDGARPCDAWLRRADLRQRQCLDTRAAYLDRYRFRTSERPDP